MILVTRRGSIDRIYYENKRIEEEPRTEWNLQVNVVKSRPELGEEMKRRLDQECLAAPMVHCEGQKGAAAKEGEDQEQLQIRQTITTSVLGVSLNEHKLKACGIYTDKLKEVVRAEFEKSESIRNEEQIVHIINEWKKSMQLQIRGETNITRRYLAVKWLVCIDQNGQVRRHALVDPGIPGDPDEGENAYVMKMSNDKETKIVPLVQMPLGMRWRNDTGSNGESSH